MRFVFLSLILLCMSPLILSADICKIDRTKGQGISSFNDCKSYTTTSDSKVCCYVKGQDADFNDVSACNELTGTEKGAATDLYDLEGYIRKYYLKADCNLGKTIALCDPDDMKSDTPLSTNICKDHYYVSLTGIYDNMKCCYLTGKNVQNKEVYSCIGIDDMFYDKQSRLTEVESGKYKRLGALKDVTINCRASFVSGFISLLVTLFSLLL